MFNPPGAAGPYMAHSDGTRSDGRPIYGPLSKNILKSKFTNFTLNFG